MELHLNDSSTTGKKHIWKGRRLGLEQRVCILKRQQVSGLDPRDFFLQNPNLEIAPQAAESCSLLPKGDGLETKDKMFWNANVQ